MKFTKIRVVNETIRTLRGYDWPEIRQERDAAIGKLQILQSDVNAMSMEFEVFAALGALQSKFASIGATAETTQVENMNYLIFTDGDTQPWWAEKPEPPLWAFSTASSPNPQAQDLPYRDGTPLL